MHNNVKVINQYIDTIEMGLNEPDDWMETDAQDKGERRVFFYYLAWCLALGIVAPFSILYFALLGK